MLRAMNDRAVGQSSPDLRRTHHGQRYRPRSFVEIQQSGSSGTTSLLLSPHFLPQSTLAASIWPHRATLHLDPPGPRHPISSGRRQERRDAPKQPLSRQCYQLIADHTPSGSSPRGNAPHPLAPSSLRVTIPERSEGARGAVVSPMAPSRRFSTIA
ncbi:uncharacterized protein PSFLO_03842 [Pseudozyma flocculosa]|uniref:Uncharacterized protein n=1 Tax=Pseudozyma flocculosa TaxID=84751 RepID=A0A5C3F320_9BASI|nr:uncharacterized protein PSFLO_03842 [Pseudozyma flocculosa]